MIAKWVTERGFEYRGWHVVTVYRRGEMGLLVLGTDNTRPDETLSMTERRIADRFGENVTDLEIKVVM